MEAGFCTTRLATRGIQLRSTIDRRAPYIFGAGHRPVIHVRLGNRPRANPWGVRSVHFIRFCRTASGCANHCWIKLSPYYRHL